MAAAFLMRAEKATAAEAIRTVRSGRQMAEPNPGFVSQLRKLEKGVRQ